MFLNIEQWLLQPRLAGIDCRMKSCKKPIPYCYSLRGKLCLVRASSENKVTKKRIQLLDSYFGKLWNEDEKPSMSAGDDIDQKVETNADKELDSLSVYLDKLEKDAKSKDFMLMSVNFTPSGGQLTVTASLRKDQLGRSVHLANLEMRLTQTGAGIPEFLLNQMFGTEEDVSEEGLSLMVSRKLVKLMNGDVQYLRQAGKSSFIITAELAAAN